MKINEFILKEREKYNCYDMKAYNRSFGLPFLPIIVLKDLTTISIQASADSWLKCKPHDNFPQHGFTHFEVRRYEHNNPLLYRYMRKVIDEPKTKERILFKKGIVLKREFIDFYISSYHFVPVRIVDKILESHGGIVGIHEEEEK